MTDVIKNVLVYGARGQQARPVARRLTELGFQVRVLTRDIDSAADLRALGVEVVAGDFTDRDSLRAASEGMDGVFLLVPFFDPQPQHGYNAIDAASDAGVRLVVWNPTGTIMPVRTGNPGLDIRFDVLKHLRASGLPHIVLQPTAYMENFLGPWTAPELAQSNSFAYPIPRAANMQWICHEDAAAFVAAAFERPQLANAVYDICGPEGLGGDEIAERLTSALGRTIIFRPMPPLEFGAVLDSAFGPGAGAGATAFYEAAQTDPSLVSTKIDITSVLAALPVKLTSLETWARDHAHSLSAKPRDPS